MRLCVLSHAHVLLDEGFVMIVMNMGLMMTVCARERVCVYVCVCLCVCVCVCV